MRKVDAMSPWSVGKVTIRHVELIKGTKTNGDSEWEIFDVMTDGVKVRQYKTDELAAAISLGVAGKASSEPNVHFTENGTDYIVPYEVAIDPSEVVDWLFEKKLKRA